MVEVKGAGMGLEKAAVVEGRPFVVVGVPAFNEEKTTAKIVIEAQRYADRVVVCDDGSTNLTAEIAERLGADVLVTLDADGQHDPREVPKIVKPIVDGVADVVIGSRFVDERLAYTIPWYRRVGVKFITKLVSNTSKHGVRDAQTS